MCSGGTGPAAHRGYGRGGCAVTVEVVGGMQVCSDAGCSGAASFVPNASSLQDAQKLFNGSARVERVGGEVLRVSALCSSGEGSEDDMGGFV